MDYLDYERIMRDRLAEVYDIGFTSYQNAAEWEAISRHLGDIREKRILDAGCGTGRFLGKLAERGPKQVVGVDFSFASLLKAKGRCALYPIVRFVQASVLALPFPDGSFEMVLCCQVVEHLLECKH